MRCISILCDHDGENLSPSLCANVKTRHHKRKDLRNIIKSIKYEPHICVQCCHTPTQYAAVRLRICFVPSLYAIHMIQLVVCRPFLPIFHSFTAFFPYHLYFSHKHLRPLVNSFTGMPYAINYVIN